VSNELDTLTQFIERLERKEKILEKQLANIRITLATVREERPSLPSGQHSVEASKAEMNGTNISVSKQLREFLPIFLTKERPKKFLKKEIYEAVKVQGIGPNHKALDAITNKVVTSLVKKGSVIKVKENKRTYYYASPELSN
jgi:hypothetical protein